MYEMEYPLPCLRRDPPDKSQYKELTKSTAYHENRLRIFATGNSLIDIFEHFHCHLSFYDA